MVTIKHVAARAGTSFKTVSRVINNDPKVRPETRQKVLQAIDELGYRPNSAARLMRSRKSGVIGLLADQVTTTPAAVDIVRRTEELASEHDKLLMVVNVEGDPHKKQRALDMLLERQVEGLIYAAMYHHPIEPLPDFYQVPTVLVNCFCEDASLPSVVPDEYGAAVEATERLLAAGHTRIAFLNLNERIVAGRLRLQGYLDTLHQHGIEPPSDYIRRTVIEIQGQETYRVDEEVKALMQLETPPTALVCAQDKIAMQAYFTLHELGLRVREDVGIISFDNMELIAANLRPGLSTMRLPHAEMGSWGVKYLLSGAQTKIQATLPCPFIERASF